MHVEKSNFLKVQELLKENKLDAILLISKQNRYWMTGYLNSSGYYFADQKHSILFVDGRYQTDIVGKTRDCEVKIVRDAFQEINVYLQNFSVKRLGVEAEYLTYHFLELIQKEMPTVTVIPVSVHKLRMTKNFEEIQNLQRAAQITDESLLEVCKNFHLGKTEDDLENELFQWFVKKGADKVFPRVVLNSGIKGALPHGKASQKMIHEGELMTIDFGSVYQGYCADMTRTVAVGEVRPELEKIYQIVKDAQQAGIDAVKPGIKCSTVHQIVYDTIAKAGFAKYFLHQTGHGIGIEVHEPPRIASYDDEILLPGMVITIEPGIYVENLGGARIEDMILVTKTGSQSLTKLNKNLTNILKEELRMEANVKVN